ncbi:MAG: HlyC/CorC family transporter [Rubrivivax sp.]|jgi:putative hemolysin|nr:HlyC/CorC family transporter [Betaproteobacteria bacterium]MBP6320226.1 HlyC/CorC family transporter [Rubrivivax sp.]MBK7275350.1 HlyC/CorC family transporter [Betaproteobacteria bacterium]MBK7514529.1 HlyC/CorC family transporter [Betaproteobacteria bacterium]MBK9681976.1 HlyC/CorC family transporter [Betaproteobacteria bacterium]
MDTALLVFLILLNGAFAMAEMGLTAARKARLQVMVESGQGGADAAMALHDDPTRWLSTVQIGITSIGLLNGIVGEAAFAKPLAAWLVERFGVGAPAANIASTAGVIVLITYFTIIFGELVPKRIGQMYPEPVARLAARPMMWLSTATKPFVVLLSASTHAVLGLLGLGGKSPGASVTEEEIAAQLEEGREAGVIEAQEHQMVRNVFRLDDRQIGSMMIPRAEIEWLDVAEPLEAQLELIAASSHSRFPVCRGSLDDVQGVLVVASLLQPLARGERPSIADHMQPPVFVPETLNGMELLEQFRRIDTDLVFVVDEYGAVQGVITERDLLEAITGEFTALSDEDAWAVSRPDGGWLLDGLIPVPELKDRLDLKELPEEDRGRYNTLAGMIMLLLGRLPRTADTVVWEDWRFEVVDLDGKRVDKVLATRTEQPGEKP